jgi:hypothetical protein
VAIRQECMNFGSITLKVWRPTTLKRTPTLTTWVNRTNALANATKTVMSQTEAAPEKPEPTPIEQAGSALQKGISGAAQAQEAEKPVTLSPLTPAPQTDISPLTPDRTTLYQAALARSPTAQVGSASAPTPPATAVSSPCRRRGNPQPKSRKRNRKHRQPQKIAHHDDQNRSSRCS